MRIFSKQQICFTVAEGKPGKNGILPLASWKLEELLDAAGAGEDARSAFDTETVKLHAGGWQSWSPGWELEPGEKHPSGVRLIPLLRKLSAAPWDCKPDGSAPRKAHARRNDAEGGFIMYLRAGSWYLVLADVSENPGLVSFSVSEDRRLIRAGFYANGRTPGERPRDETVVELNVFLACGYFAFKDQMKQLYSDGRFASLAFLGKGTPGLDFRPGGYASWYNHYTNIDEAVILSDLEGLLNTDNVIALRYLKKGQPAVFQIDDGWERAVGDWEINSARFPRRLKYLAEQIENAGLIPGLWLAPFLVTRRSRIFKERPEWVLRDGSCPVKAGWNPLWDGVFYCLDLSREDVLGYLRSLMDKVIDEWGFRYIKLDFLYAGFLSGIPSGCYERAVALLTERTGNAAGLPLAYLGCGLPLGASYRHFPLSRIGTDTRESWDWPLAKLIRHEGRPSALLSLRDTIGRAFMNGTVYVNDPDVIFLRSANCSLTETEKECIAIVNFLFAGQIMCSDNFFALDKTDLSFARRIYDLYEELEGDEYGPVGLGRDVFLIESRLGTVAGLVNLTDKPFFLNEKPERFTGGTWLVDHRLSQDHKDRLCFAPRSVSIYRRIPLT